MKFSYRILQTLKEMREIKPLWQQLIREIPRYFPTMTYEWNEAWYLANLYRTEQIFVVLFFDLSGRLTAVIPLYSHTNYIAFFKMRMLSLFGSQDEQITNIIAQEEHKIQVIHDLVHVMEQKFSEWDLISFHRLNYARGDSVILERVLNRAGITYRIESMTRTPYLRLNADWDNLNKSFSKHLLNLVTRNTNKLEKFGDITYKITESPLTKEQLSIFQNLEEENNKDLVECSEIQNQWTSTLYSDLKHLNEGEIRLYQTEMHVGGILLSSALCFRTRDGFYVCKAASDKKYRYAAPALLLRLFEIKYACEQGLRHYTFAEREQRWMKYFTPDGHFTLDMVIYHKHVSSFIRYFRFNRSHQKLLKQLKSR